jgi:hypothetical protein
VTRFIEGEPRNQSVLFPECLDDGIAEDNLVRAVHAFIDELHLAALGFDSDDPRRQASTLRSHRPVGGDHQLTVHSVGEGPLPNERDS